jgi:hypothetical protein
VEIDQIGILENAISRQMVAAVLQGSNKEAVRNDAVIVRVEKGLPETEEGQWGLLGGGGIGHVASGLRQGGSKDAKLCLIPQNELD